MPMDDDWSFADVTAKGVASLLLKDILDDLTQLARPGTATSKVAAASAAP